jgi:hypothetical protein
MKALSIFAAAVGVLGAAAATTPAAAGGYYDYYGEYGYYAYPAHYGCARYYAPCCPGYYQVGYYQPVVQRVSYYRVVGYRPVAGPRRHHRYWK